MKKRTYGNPRKAEHSPAELHAIASGEQQYFFFFFLFLLQSTTARSNEWLRISNKRTATSTDQQQTEIQTRIDRISYCRLGWQLASIDHPHLWFGFATARSTRAGGEGERERTGIVGLLSTRTDSVGFPNEKNTLESTCTTPHRGKRVKKTAIWTLCQRRVLSGVKECVRMG